MSDAAMLAEQARIPDHVVHRTFVRETVVLNLKTGKYHGLNLTAGRMFELFDGAATLQDMAARLSEEYEKPLDEVEHDLCELVAQLCERGLVELGSTQQA
jgi:Coenzyme PQQ synthesis protein D (PqqD)